jgi:hypothetical protein
MNDISIFIPIGRAPLQRMFSPPKYRIVFEHCHFSIAFPSVFRGSHSHGTPRGSSPWNSYIFQLSLFRIDRITSAQRSAYRTFVGTGCLGLSIALMSLKSCSRRATSSLAQFRQTPKIMPLRAKITDPTFMATRQV